MGPSNAMPAQRDRTRAPGGETADVLARRLGEAVSSGANGNGNGHVRRNGNGAIETHSAREIAIDVCSAILAETSAGTAEHSSDVVLITEAIGKRMGIAGTEEGDLLAAARLHDIGKVLIPSGLLEKPGPLTDEEWEVMRRHTVAGQEILSSVAELAQVGRLVRHSHERWDGGGYPDGLGGAEIPLGSRIIFCADAFHAIRSDRPYRPGSSADEALQEVRRCAGSQFDPDVVRELVEVVRERRRRPRGTGRSARLLALFMCLVVGGAGTAIARSGLLGEPTAPPLQGGSAPSPPPACGTAACPGVAVPVGGLGPVGGPGWVQGPRPLHPGLPGTLHSENAGPKPGANGAPGTGDTTGNPGKGNGNGKSEANHGKSAAAEAPHRASGHGNASHHGAPHPTGSHNGGSHQGSAGTSGSSANHGSGNVHPSGSGGNGSTEGGGSSGGGNGSSSGGGSGQSSSGPTGSDEGAGSPPGNSGNAPEQNK